MVGLTQRTHQGRVGVGRCGWSAHIIAEGFENGGRVNGFGQEGLHQLLKSQLPLWAMRFGSRPSFGRLRLPMHHGMGYLVYIREQESVGIEVGVDTDMQRTIGQGFKIAQAGTPGFTDAKLKLVLLPQLSPVGSG